MSLDPEIAALFDKVMGSKPTKKKTTKKSTTPADPLKAQFKEVTRSVRQREKAKKGYQSGNGYEYEKVWNEDGSSFKYIPRARAVMAKVLGHEVPDHMRVFFRNRDLKGDAKYAPENLVLGFKSGVPLDLLTCKNCGCRGNWEFNSPPNGEERDSE